MISLSEFSCVAGLDLDPIKVKLMHEESGEGWSLDYANAVEFEYRRFLYLMKKFPNEQTAPLFDVDVFWHYHILDTMKYATDCEQVFGYFLHHFPYIGLRGEEDLAAHRQVGERMRELYEQTFGESYVRPTASTHAADLRAAFSGATSAVAFSGATSAVAFSGATAKVAFSGATAQAHKSATADAGSHTAFSGATANFAFSGASVQTRANRFYLTRPSLPLSA